jgi:hypothetical protein
MEGEEKEKVLIIKKKEARMSFKVRTKKKNAYAPDDYIKVVNPKDYNQMALLFEDLDLLIGAPIEKAFREYKERKERGFPF